MSSKCIIIKSQSKDFFNALIYKIKEIKNIRFFTFHINGFYTLVIKCHNYYNSNSVLDDSKLYGSYIFLYSLVSIILSELFLSYYEHIVSTRIISAKCKINKKHRDLRSFTDSKSELDFNKLSSISSLLLDENSPLEFSNVLYKKRKSLLLDSILKNFRNKNYIYADYFIDFNSPNYIKELDKIINTSIEILGNKPLYNYVMQFIFK